MKKILRNKLLKLKEDWAENCLKKKKMRCGKQQNND